MSVDSFLNVTAESYLRIQYFQYCTVFEIQIMTVCWVDTVH